MRTTPIPQLDVSLFTMNGILALRRFMMGGMVKLGFLSIFRPVHLLGFLGGHSCLAQLWVWVWKSRVNFRFFLPLKPRIKS